MRTVLIDHARYQVRLALVEAEEQSRRYIRIVVTHRHIQIIRNNGSVVWLKHYVRKYGWVAAQYHGELQGPDDFVRPCKSN